MHLRATLALLCAGACAVAADRLEFRTTKPEVLRERLEMIVSADAERANSSRLGKDRWPSVQAMVNVDSIGMTPSKIQVSRSDKRLVRIAAALAIAIGTTVEGIDVEQAGDTDSRPFRLDAIRMEHYVDTHKLLAAVLDTHFDRNAALQEAGSK